MKTFNDASGRSWTLTLTFGAAIAVKSKLDVDLLQIEAGDPPLLTRLGTDELLLGEILLVMLEGQFEKHKVTEDDVRNAFDGATLLAAQKAFYAEMIDFFRSRGRKDRAAAVAKQMTMIDAAIEAIEQRIDAIDVETTIRNSGGGATPGGSPEVSASIHAT
jgi:hypothetical protein